MFIGNVYTLSIKQKYNMLALQVISSYSYNEQNITDYLGDKIRVALLS